MGLSLRNVAVTLTTPEGKAVYEDFGEMLFTHFGVSGPVILSASAFLDFDKHPFYRLHIDLKPALSREALDQRVLSDLAEKNKRDLVNALDDLLPQKLIVPFLGATGLDGRRKVHSLGREERLRLTDTMKDLPLTVTGHRPIKEAIDHINLRKYIIETTKAAYKVFLIWAAAIVVLVVLRETEVINDAVLFLITAAFYVCDLICVLIWCPFRLMMKNRCCTTCRIFNWDHLMMFSPLIFAGGFYAISLVVLALAAWLVWEMCVMLFPERFWEFSNEALKCSQCTDKLCTQYCQKLRK
jgi:hypothetical protein